MKDRMFLYWMVVLVCFGCSHKREVQEPSYGNTPLYTNVPVYSFAVHPLHNPEKLIQNYQPLIDYLNSKVKNARLTLESSRDYASFEKKYQCQKPDFLLPNPWQTLQAMKVGYHVIAMAGEPADFKGIFIIRKNSNIQKPSDLKGKSVSYPAPTALAACIMPQYFLYCSGIDVSSDIVNKYVGSQESSIMNVYLGKTAAGATWPPPWRAFQKEHPKEASELRIIWETESLINNSVMIRNNLPIELQQQVQKLLTGLQETKSGRAILSGMETTRFLAASDKDYEVVRTYVNRFEKEVRKIETK
jgi:phosphonate transport system substrate-binding protein